MLTLQAIVLSFVAIVLLVGFGLLLVADRYSSEPTPMNGRVTPIDILNG